MYCTACGAQNSDNAPKCTACGKDLVRVGPVTPVHIANHLVWAILVTIFCCLPFGIVAIVYAAQVNSKAQAGNVTGAMESSRKAKMWCWWAFGVGFVAQALILGLQIVGIIAGAGA